MIHTELIWHEGPANGGGGTAGKREGAPWWYDGETIIAIFETTTGREIVILRVLADESGLSFTDTTTGDDFSAWSDLDIHWWAKLTKDNTPPEP